MFVFTFFKDSLGKNVDKRKYFLWLSRANFSPTALVIHFLISPVSKYTALGYHSSTDSWKMEINQQCTHTTR